MEEIADAFMEIARLADALGEAPINQHEGLWYQKLDDSWEIWVNPHEEELEAKKGAHVPPFHCYVEFNEWPAGLFSPHGGTLAAGEAANEGAFVEAIRAATPTQRQRGDAHARRQR